MKNLINAGIRKQKRDRGKNWIGSDGMARIQILAVRGKNY